MKWREWVKHQSNKQGQELGGEQGKPHWVTASSDALPPVARADF